MGNAYREPFATLETSPCHVQDSQFKAFPYSKLGLRNLEKLPTSPQLKPDVKNKSLHFSDTSKDAVHFQLPATACHPQSLSPTVSREAPDSLLNSIYCQELSEACLSDNGWVQSLNPLQSGPFSIWQNPSFSSLGRKRPSSAHNYKEWPCDF